MTDDHDRLARALLCRISEPGSLPLGRLVARVGPAAAVEAVRGDGGGLPEPLLGGLRQRLAVARPEADLAALARAGGRFVCPGDDEWPPGLEVLHGIGEPAFGLFVRGTPRLADVAERAVAIVGSRAATEYGAYVAAELAAGLADRGWTVVSGGAYGIDGAAHRGAIAAGGVTVAVLACGVDVAYPRGHDALFRRILDNGLLVSEHPPGCAPQRLRFLVRNRLIAALAAGTVVVEAAIRSGAQATASYAARLSRQLMAVPGPVTAEMSVGCHRLIRDGAQLVTRPAEVLEMVGEYGVDALPLERGPERPEDLVTGTARQVFEAVPLSVPVPSRDIAVVAGVDERETLRRLKALQRAGLVVTVNGRWARAPALRTRATASPRDMPAVLDAGPA